MGDLGFISGMIGYAIQLAGDQIIHHIKIAVRCRKELDTLKDLVTHVISLNLEMQEYRKALNSGKIRTSHHALPSAVNEWLQRLNELLQEASDLAQSCTVPSSYHLIPRYRTSKRIARHISLIREHLKSPPTIAFLHQLQQDVVNQGGLREITESVHSLKLAVSMPATTSGDCSTPSTQQTAMSRMKYIEEPAILGQDYAYERVEHLIEYAQHANVSRIGLVGMGGSGKTLLLKRLFNSQKVQNFFCNGLLLWLTVSQSPPFQTLRNDLVKQIALQTNERLESREDEEQVKVWLNLRMKENKFALFLDDVWETNGSSLLGELAVPLFPPTNSNIIFVSSRDARALLQMGVPHSSIIQMEELKEEDSWKLFSSHAFLYNDGNLPATINKEIATSVCKECRGLPLAIKVIARAMAGITNSKEWESTLTRLHNAEQIKYGDVSDTLYGRLRLSYDALAEFDLKSLQFCFLYLAAFHEDDVISTIHVSMYWIGEGLVAGDNPFQIGQSYVNLLADRCLIEATLKDIDRNVLVFRVHDVLYDLARQISEREENCFFRAGKGLQEFPSSDCSRKIRISLKSNGLTSIPSTFRAPHIRSWIILDNPLEQIPKDVIGSMHSLTVLDLSGTSLRSLPESLGHLKHLVCLRLVCVPIKRLPKSVTALKSLQILDLYGSSIRELSSTINKLSSLKYLDITSCRELQSIPCGISQLTSLEYLYKRYCPINIGQNKGEKDSASINTLGNLKQLKRLMLDNNGEAIQEGTLGRMVQMEYLDLVLTEMESLPDDMDAMSKLRNLTLTCPQLIKMKDTFCGFQYLSYIKLYSCKMLKQLPDLHKLVSLKQLDIVSCSSIEKLPKEFGEREAFPMLEVFSLVELNMLEELPEVEEGGMSSLKTFTIMECEELKMLPHGYWNLEKIEKIRVYGCSTVQASLSSEENLTQKSTKVEIVTMSSADSRAVRQRLKETRERKEQFRYGEVWRDDHLQFMYQTFFSLNF